MSRGDGRRPDELRPVVADPAFLEQPHGVVLWSQGKTRVLCTASIQDGVPRWLYRSGRGWMTAEYSLLPASTGDRTDREAARGKQGGRTVEIQRLIGRALRGVVDFQALGERTVYLDCDVLQADGGTRCAAITGAYVAAQRALAVARGDVARGGGQHLAGLRRDSAADLDHPAQTGGVRTSCGRSSPIRPSSSSRTASCSGRKGRRGSSARRRSRRVCRAGCIARDAAG